MRWKFPDRDDHEEATARQAVTGRIDAWWREFARNAAAIDKSFKRGSGFDLVGFMANHLQAIDESLMWEYGPALKGEGHRLAISPEAEHGLHPMTEVILARAPKVPGFEFYQGRPAEGPEWAVQTVEGRVGVNIAKGSIRVDIGEFNRVDVLFFFPGIGDSDTANNAAFVASESLFGEPTLDRWVGVIEALPRPEGTGWMPLADAATAMQRGIDAVRESLPDAPWSEWINDATWTSLELNAPEDVPREPWGWNDLLLGTVPHTEMLQGILRGQLFYSGRFSRHGETFCYVKFDESELESRFDMRRPAEDALDEALRQAGLGCTCGGGTGVWHGYAMLALTDVSRAIPLIRQVLAAARVPNSTWLQFLDFDLCDEWIGVYSDTPPPPRPEA